MHKKESKWLIIKEKILEKFSNSLGNETKNQKEKYWK